MPHKTIEARREFARKWRALHPGYTAEKSRRYRAANPNAAHEEYLRHKSAYVSRSKAWQAKNPDKARASKKKAADKILAKDPEYHRRRGRIWALQNSERKKELNRAWKNKNRDRINARRRERAATGTRIEEKARRVARLKQNESADCTARIRLLKLMPFCQYCFGLFSRKLRRTIEHVIPVSRGGGHVPHNLVAACGACNSSKRDKLLTEWSGPIMGTA